MSGTSNGLQAQGPKTCRLAFGSVALGITGFFVTFALALLVGGPITWFGPLGGALGIVLGVAALRNIRRSAGLLKGRVLAICGILGCALGQILGIYLAGLVLFYGHEISWRAMCAENLRQLGAAMRTYASRGDGLYPAGSEWCELIKGFVVAETFVCPRTKHLQAQCSYALNPNVEPNSPGDVVLLFETKGGWNQHGGPELLNPDNHGGKGCNILFNDGHVEFVKTDQFGNLKWKVDRDKE